SPEHNTTTLGLSLGRNSLFLSFFLSTFFSEYFTLELDNEIDRRAPIFIENEGARLSSEWAPSAKGCAIAATCILSPFLIGFGPTALSKDPTAHALMAGPHSPPLTRTRTIGLKPEHYRLTRPSCLSLSLYKVKSKFPYVLNLLSWPWNACLYVLRLA
ncbi:hypothetical protein IGI04_023504, partial [Brassica rapa subsp. trilocularis]